ncbi:hypothetical protein ScPMuIL_012746 [Solemya velum]
MADSDTGSLRDHMTRLRMKMVQQKIANEREKLRRPSTGGSSEDDEADIKMQNALRRRQELLEKLKQEQLINGEYRRPQTYSARRRYRTPSPLPPPSRRSLPDYYRHRDLTFRYPEHFRDVPPPKREMSQVKHVIEHRVATPNHHNLPPLPNQLPPPPPAPLVIPPLQPIMQSQPQHIIQQVPQPVFQNLMPPEQKAAFNKGDFMEMMMMQNAQMHHLVMQQMMLGNVSGGSRPYPAAPVVAAEPAQAPVMMTRQPAVHHHHYSSPPQAPSNPVVHHYQSLPPLEYRTSPGRGDNTTRRYQSRYRGDKNTSRSRSEPLRRLRHIFYAAWFIEMLKSLVKKNAHNRPSSVFLFSIILKEIVAALHRIFLNPQGNVYPVLSDIFRPEAPDLYQLTHESRISDRDRATIIQELKYLLENIIYHITEIMPSSGVLGTHRKSAVYELIRSGKRFPDGYFWTVEMDQINFTQNGRTADVSEEEAFILLTGIFISRSLITTLLMKPVDYGLSSRPLTDVGERNLKFVASIVLYLIRRVSVVRTRIMPLPYEISKYLFSDDEMKGVYSRLEQSFLYSEGLLREWGQEYVKRLRQAAHTT